MGIKTRWARVAAIIGSLVALLVAAGAGHKG
jgi:hypothetical protein